MNRHIDSQTDRQKDRQKQRANEREFMVCFCFDVALEPRLAKRGVIFDAFDLEKGWHVAGVVVVVACSGGGGMCWW